jgi:hypothetical protein
VPLHFAENTAVLEGAVVVDDAEPLAAWLRTVEGPRVDLAGCAHLHTAALQALMAARVKVGTAPADDFLRAWILPLLETAPAEEAVPVEDPADEITQTPTVHTAPEEALS